MMKTFEKTYTIKAPIDKVWRAFLDPEIIEQWGGGPAKMHAEESTEFSLWGGDIHGTNTKVIENKLLEQDWFSGKWEQPSKLTFSFKADGNETTVHLSHADIPDEEVRDIAQGWQDYYLGPIKELLEN